MKQSSKNLTSTALCAYVILFYLFNKSLISLSNKTSSDGFGSASTISAFLSLLSLFINFINKKIK